jgi:hypothetical protein
MICDMDADRKNRERRRAAHERASKAHERAARTESEAADFYESRGEVEKAARHRAQSEQQVQWAQDDADRAAKFADDSGCRERERERE